MTETATPWMDAVAPLIERFEVASAFDMSATHNAVGSAAIAKLMREMATNLDRHIAMGCGNTRAALTDHQSAREPVAWLYRGRHDVVLTERLPVHLILSFETETPLYAAPQPAPVDNRLLSSNSVDDSKVGVDDRQTADEFIAEALRLGGSGEADR